MHKVDDYELNGRVRFSSGIGILSSVSGAHLSLISSVHRTHLSLGLKMITHEAEWSPASVFIFAQPHKSSLSREN
jgi:hypothetical protein